MKILEFLNQLIVSLPVNKYDGHTFKESVIEIQKEFLKNFHLIDEDDLKLFLPDIPLSDKKLTKKILIRRFNQIYSKLNNAIEQYYKGKPASAYQEIKQLLLNVSYIRDLSDVYQGFLQIKDFRNFDELNWYRLRNLTKHESQNPKSSYLFHPPFEKRGKVGNYRFSLSGFPCLYLGDSINLCWEEINKLTENIYASRLTFTGNHSFLRPLNITIPDRFTEEIYVPKNTLNYEAFCFLITFPITQLCLFKVKDENINDYFKPEYIIPQLLYYSLKLDKNLYFQFS